MKMLIIGFLIANLITFIGVFVEDVSSMVEELKSEDKYIDKLKFILKVIGVTIISILFMPLIVIRDNYKK